MHSTQPLVSVIVPVRDSGNHIGGLLESLLAQDYPNYEVILVGNYQDSTWQYITPHPQLFVFEADIPPTHKGRDTNWKRRLGANVARGDVLFYTDVKIRHPENWISRGIELMQEHDVESVAGVMLSTRQRSAEETFMEKFTDSALVKRNPDFGKGYVLTRKNFGNRESLPITACWAMTRDAYERMGGFNQKFVYSYEDYSAAWQSVAAGERIFCSSGWAVYHKHRTAFSEITREYKRSAYGAAQLFQVFPDCPFARRRLGQVLAVLFALLLMVVVPLGLLLAGELASLAILIGLGIIGFFGLGLLNIVKAGWYWRALFFPPLTAFFILVFSLWFMRKLLAGGKADPNKLLQITTLPMP